MNYLAHLYLAQPNADSHMGNLLGDFRKGTDITKYSNDILSGLDNHYLVDRYTDGHEIVKSAKQLFEPRYRRFSGIAIDVLFDHFLINHWHSLNKFESNEKQSFERFKQQSYHLLLQRQLIMPERMERVVGMMVDDDWFEQYRDLSGVERALINIAKRIRFNNDFAGCVSDVNRHYQAFEQAFLNYFPQLLTHVENHALESS
ncbi:DUF479 domain-containing protein [Thalassotalea sp. LPB0316]|uniref:acyl carrier protein phosphodiesterase n=1 Tax=Thalassotalea sp. LPB0316 TaxID=2769490 RepID=UPI0018670DEB|nr:ACP phosphodiesterase [Thalassotalea sp. LPB0316]QOL26850.1 DUF479 domain-containing protein [Thalassotalea sp. LPB0316]